MSKISQYIRDFFANLGPRHFVGVLIAALTYYIDRVIKNYVDKDLGMALHETIELLPFFDLTRVHNYGTSMGMFTATSPEQRAILIFGTALIAAMVFVWMLCEKHKGEIFGLALILGGALGNIVDRKTHGYVLDYADFHVFGVRPFLVFNLADAAITIGVVIILARALLLRDKGDENQADPNQSES